MVMITSAEVQVFTIAETGFVEGDCCELERSTAMMSARLPISSDPISSSSLSARAPPMVAISSIDSESRKRPTLTARWMSMPRRISESMSVESVAAGESVPMPTRRPARMNSSTGATPMPSCALQRGHTAMATLYSLSFFTSSSSVCTQWMASTLGDSKAPQFSA